jgi:hypothetical protein
MEAEEYKNTIFYSHLKKNKKVQDAIKNLSSTEDWQVLREFLVEIKGTLLEGFLSTEKPDDYQRGKNYIHVIMAMYFLPDLARSIRDEKLREKKDQALSEKEALQRKFNPGAGVKKIVNKIKGVK